jgi:hypothetical protein
VPSGCGIRALRLFPPRYPSRVRRPGCPVHPFAHRRARRCANQGPWLLGQRGDASGYVFVVRVGGFVRAELPSPDNGCHGAGRSGRVKWGTGEADSERAERTSRCTGKGTRRGWQADELSRWEDGRRVRAGGRVARNRSDRPIGLVPGVPPSSCPACGFGVKRVSIRMDTAMDGPVDTPMDGAMDTHLPARDASHAESRSAGPRPARRPCGGALFGLRWGSAARSREGRRGMWCGLRGYSAPHRIGGCYCHATRRKRRRASRSVEFREFLEVVLNCV